MTLHNLKVWPEFWPALSRNLKKVEVRKADRDFKFGDTLLLQEFIPETGQYTGQMCERMVTHVLQGGQFGIAEGYVALSICPPPEEDL